MSDLEQSVSRVARRSDSLNIPLVRSTDEDGWLMTYLDVITLLLVMFVVMLALSGGPTGLPVSPDAATPSAPATPQQKTPPTADVQRATPDPAAEFAARALSFLEQAGLSEDVDVVLEEGGVNLRIGSEILFASGTATLSNDGMDQLETLVPLLLDTDYQLMVAGHTDNLPISSPRFPSNWELSSARAGSVVRLFEAEGIAPARLQATGFADTRPLARNDTERGRARNRRVELVLRPPVGNTES